LIVLTFDNPDEASEVRQTLKAVARGGHEAIDDTAVIVKDADGKIHLRNEADRGIKTGAITGGLAGLIVSFMFPIAGIVVGAAGGALVGKLFHKGIDQKFVKDVAGSLKPNSSALFMLTSADDPEAVLAAMGSSSDMIHKTMLDPEVERQLRDQLDTGR
jgi:uncharacterized membrane protein